MRRDQEANALAKREDDDDPDDPGGETVHSLASGASATERLNAPDFRQRRF
jgi:hypothetical protein